MKNYFTKINICGQIIAIIELLNNTHIAITPRSTCVLYVALMIRMPCMFHAWHFTRARMIPCSSHVKCHARHVPCVFHGILHVKVHVHTLRGTWSTQIRDVNLEYLCRVSLRVHACKSEVINERYCMSENILQSIQFNIAIVLHFISYKIMCIKNSFTCTYMNS